MNRQCYRLVFNRAKGQLVAASELAVTTGKSPKESGRVGRRKRPLQQPAALGLLAALLLGSPGVQASIASDPNAPGNQRPTVLETANGVPQVNIQTPSAAGVSRNSYRQFDVTSKGVILNNSRSNTQTQLSGWVQGNPHLTSGEARVILNEVNSRHPSQLRGYLEVAGSRAEVVIANPAGIDVNGAGFINASRATLTTGTPELRNGELTGYRVQQGSVNISGAGLDASGTDYTAILARAVEVQGGVWANELEVVTGANRIGRDGQIERLNAQGDAPDVAIDVAHLGGMYAGKIRLVATEAGVGVNNAGSIAATHAGGVGEVVLTADGRIVNRGAITAQGDIQLTSQTGINNADQGAILAQGDLTLSASGGQGRIHSAADAILAAGVDANSLTLGDRGQLSLSAGDTITTQGRQLAGGGFLAEADTVTLVGSQTQARDIAITARDGDIDASGATLSASDTLTASAAATLRTDDASVQADRLELSAAVISNRDGELIQAGEGSMTLDARQLDNHSGLVASHGDLQLNVDTLDNRSGSVLAAQDLTVQGGSLNNEGGQLGAGGDLTLDVATVVNRDGVLDAGSDLTLNGERLDNRQGTLLAGGELEATLTQSVNNRDGVMGATGTATLRSGELDNAEGTLIADAGLHASLDTLHGRGDILSQGDLTLDLANDYRHLNGARLQAAGNVALDVAGNLINEGHIGSGDRLQLQAHSLDNRTSGEISADDTHLAIDATLTNRGLIDGVTTRIDASTLDNIGTGRIYGDWLGIQATTLTNRRSGGLAPVIAARERLDLGVRNLTNRDEALIFSAGNMAIAGRLDAEGNATGQARRIDNRSATIESLGDMNISAGEINNINDYFEVRLALIDSTPQEIFVHPFGWDEKISASRLQWRDHVSYLRGTVEGYVYRISQDGPLEQIARWEEYDIERDIYESQVVNSLPGLLLAGGKMLLSGGSLINDKSRILAGGELSSNLERLENRVAEGVRRVIENGMKRSTTPGMERCDGGEQGCDGTYWYPREWSEWIAYNDRYDTTINLQISEFSGNRATSGSGTQVKTTTVVTVDSAARDTRPTGGERAAELPLISTAPPTVSLPSNSLFQLRPSGIRPLIETDPRFTNQRQWLSSDYLLSALHPDPAMTQKRLGDGFYEQRLIREQITQLTGQRFLAGYSDDEAQYAALMNNAATFAQQHGLRPGVALTAEQMAQLTSDIVWLVEQTVTLEDGRQVKVLVPQVYARVRDGDLRGDGTLIAGSSLDLNVAGELINSGTLAARQGVTVAADRIANLNGRIAGDEVSLTAASDLLHRGGDIDGRAVTLFAGRDLALQGGSVSAERELTLQAGRDLALTSQAGRQTALTVTGSDGLLQASAGRDLSIAGAALDSAGSLALHAERDLSIASTLDSQSTRYGRVTLSRADIGHQATLNAGQDLLLNAGRDLSLAAVDVSADGSGLIAAGRDLSLETLTTGSALRGTPRLQRSRQQEIGTTLAIGNDLTLMAGQDLYARAANVSAEGDLDVIAGRNIEIEAGQSSRYDEQRRGRTHTIDSRSRVQGSDFAAGGHLSLTAGEDLRLTASRLQAGESAALLAGGNIELLTAQEHDYSLYESRRRSLLGGSRTQRDEVSRTRSIGSEVTVGGDLLLASGLDQTYRAARLEADGDITLQSGGTIRFETASDVHTESHERSRSSFAWQSARGEGFARETLRHSELVAQGELIIQAADGIHIDVERIDRRSVTRSIDAMVAANPDLAWLKEMEQRGDVDWQQVKAFHDSWDYSHSGLGAGAALAISIVASAWAGPAAAGLVDGAIASAMVGAGAGSLAGTGAVSLANNRGDLGAAFSDTFSSGSLRGAATAALTAGATRGMTDQVWGTQTNPTTGATNNLKLSLNNGSDIARFAGQRATQAAIDAGIRSAVEGGSYRSHLGDSLENAVTHVVSGVLFHAVGDLAFDKRWDEGGVEKIALHALIGGSVAEAMGGDFRTGALAAGASEALVHHLVEDGHTNPILSNTVAQLVGIVAAELSGGDVNDGAFIAGQVESYNRQLHSAERMLARDLADLSEGRFTLEEIEQAMRGMHNDGLGEGRSANTIVDLHDLAGIDANYFDYGGDWRAIPGPDGTTRYLIQQVPTDAPPELIAYIIAQTGGENSPYRAPVYQLPAEEAAPGQPRDRLTGRPLDEEGRYTVSYVVDGKIYHVPHFSCGDATCNALGANVDYSDPGAQAWARALNARTLKDLSNAATLATMINPVGAVAFGVGLSGSAVNVVSGYLSDSFMETSSAEAAQHGFEKYAIARGMPQAQAIRFANALSLAGFWDDIVDNAKNMGSAP
jgi:filamentous hemagglutinin